MDIYEGILEAVEMELEEVAKKGRFTSKDEVHCVYELVGIARRIHAIWAYEEPQAEAGSLFSRNSYDNGGNYDNGGSYNNGGSYDGYSNRMNSRRMSRNGGSYRNSRHDEESFVKKMQEMRKIAPDEQTKMEIDRLLSEMGQ
jgi:hypothetical protein